MGVEEQMKVISVNVSEPKTVLIDGKPLTTGIYKEPVSEPLFVTKLNFKRNDLYSTRTSRFYNTSSFCN
jgi:MOSC domain-containing protein YiiM